MRAAELAALAAAQLVVAALVADSTGELAGAAPLLVAQLAAIYATGLLLGGRRLAAWAGACWIAVPALLQYAFVARYRPTWRDAVLPEALALDEPRRFAAMLALTVAALLLLVGLETRRALALGGSVAALAVAGALDAFPTSAALDLDALNGHFIQLREYFWSARVFEFVPIAGAIAVARRSPAFAIVLALWLGVFFVLIGSDPGVSVPAGSFWTTLLPAWPAYVLLFASLPLLVPRLGAGLVARGREFRLEKRQTLRQHDRLVGEP